MGHSSALLPLMIGATIGGGFGCVNAPLIDKIRIVPLIATLWSASVVGGLLLGAIGAKIVNADKISQGLMDAGSVVHRHTRTDRKSDCLRSSLPTLSSLS
jgi:ribose/xylose/arabinose/galactoside ABC-type transport system permease subunit